MQLRGTRALVMGLGVHGGGLGVARFLAQQGAHVTVTDLRNAEQLQGSIDALAELPIRYVLGEHREQDFAQAELVVKNPGVPASSRFLQIARASGAAIETEMTLFFRLCPGPILGVTGTKGKTTTTLALGAMLREQFPDTVVAGNLRVSALEQLPKIGPHTPVALELSSFALENLGEAGLSPRHALVTNLSPDHLDRYATMHEYGAAKRQIFLHQGADGLLVLNRRDATTRTWAADAPGQVIWFDHDDEQAAPVMASTMHYGQRGLIWHAADGQAEHICEQADVRVLGAHNYTNVAAAAALARAVGVTGANIRRALAGFTGVEHRLELVRELAGVRFVNDTAATVPEAAIAALDSFDAPIVLICGGADKRLALDAFARAIAEKAKAVVLLDGTATPKLQAALATAVLQFDPNSPALRRRGEWAGSGQAFTDFEAAIRAARALAAPGEIVLLSPGCASFGMFRNEFHRGEEFRRIVNQF
ncbi:MAG: UDP-N-acetylmuramoyl-L-alanine--D-glutamate ligase [Roseiflexaceae bacterium]|nr:UDP-N-acetylmuramoyl-L-alanine--D-glutamate ligase [Roseiflexaceae bacterium]